MAHDKDGNRLFRKVTVKIVFPDAIFPPKTIVSHAGPRQGFGPGGIDDVLMSVADQLDTLYPFWNFKPVELVPVGGTARYVFTFAGYNHGLGVPVAVDIKDSVITEQPIADSTAQLLKVAETPHQQEQSLALENTSQ